MTEWLSVFVLITIIATCFSYNIFVPVLVQFFKDLIDSLKT